MTKEGARVRVKKELKDIPKVGEKQKFEERFKSQKAFEEDNAKVVVIPKRIHTAAHSHTLKNVKDSIVLDKNVCCGICNSQIFYH